MVSPSLTAASPSPMATVSPSLMATVSPSLTAIVSPSLTAIVSPSSTAAASSSLITTAYSSLTAATSLPLVATAGSSLTTATSLFPIATINPSVTTAISLISLLTPLTRLNTIISFDVVIKTHLPLPPISLRTQGIAELLQHYPDKQFVDNLISIATYGARIGYKEPPASTRRSNYASALMHPNIVNTSIKSKLEKGRIKELTDLPKYYFCSPININLVYCRYSSTALLTLKESTNYTGLR